MPAIIINPYAYAPPSAGKKIGMVNQLTNAIPSKMPIWLSTACFDSVTTNNEAFWTVGETDGGDIECYENNAGALGARMGVDILEYDHTNKRLCMAVAASSDIPGSGLSGKFWIVRNNGQTSQPAVTASGGSKEVWERSGGPLYNHVAWGNEGTVSGRPASAVRDPNYYNGRASAGAVYNLTDSANAFDNCPTISVGGGATDTETISIRRGDADTQRFLDNTRDKMLASFSFYLESSQPNISPAGWSGETDGNCLFGRGNEASTNTIMGTDACWSVRVDDTNNKLEFWVRESDGGISHFECGAAPSTGAWHSICLQLNGSNTPLVYIDGVARTVTDQGSWDGTFETHGASNFHAVWFGTAHTKDAGINGRFCNIRFWQELSGGTTVGSLATSDWMVCEGNMLAGADKLFQGDDNASI